jgi:hypothetical protein
MNEINDSNSHALDGCDPDVPQTRHGRSVRFPAASDLVDDYRELESMNEADVKHYASTPGGSRHNSISRG